MPERVLIVGLGSIGRRHARLIRQAAPGVRIAALRRTGSKPDGQEWVDQVFHTLEEAILQFRPQAAVIASPAPLHLESALGLARAGIHLLVEKPLAASAAGVAELIALCATQQVVLATGYNLRFSTSLQEFRSQLGRAGDLISVRAEVGQFLPGWRPDADYRQAVSASSALGGGALLELSHEFDYLQWIFGDASSVCASVDRQSALEIDVEDTAHIVMCMKAQTAVGASLKIRLDLDLYRHDTTRTCVAIGSAGSLRWNGIAGTVEFFAPGAAGWEQTFAHKPQRDETYQLQWEHFRACIRTGSLPAVDGNAGLKVLTLIDAARKSAELSCTVPVG